MSNSHVGPGLGVPERYRLSGSNPANSRAGVDQGDLR